MRTINEVLERTIDLHPDPAEKQFQSTIDGLHRLFDELARPENHELMRFVFAWQKLEQEIAKLQRKIEERTAEKPVNKLNQFLQQLRKKQ